jgi:hypothetical protein
MKLQEIYKIKYSIIDRGIQYPAKAIETNDHNSQRAVKKHLNKWSHAMDLSKDYKFIIDKVDFVGYGNI